MSEPTSTKKALLGELESIKGLLDEDDIDFDQIPTLEDDIPLLEEAIDEELNEPAPATQAETGAPATQDSETKLPPGVLPGQQPLFDDTLEIAFSAAQPTAESAPADDTHALDEIDSVLELSIKQAYASYLGDSSATESAPTTETENTQQAVAPHEPDTLQGPAAEKPNPFAIPLAPHRSGHEVIREQAPHLSGLASAPSAAEDGNTATTEQPKADATTPPQALRGENPFLPKHIRERLHTQKSLTDIIRDETTNWAPTTVSKSATASIVDNLIDEYMPKIESELRRRLTLILEGKSTTEADTPDNPSDNG